MTVVEVLCVLIVAFTSCAYGQFDLVPNRLGQQSAFGLFDGQIVQMDDTLLPARGQFSQFGGRLGQLPRNLGRERSVFGRPFGPTFPTASGLQQCTRSICSAQIIPRRCRYTPVLVGPRGDYCLGCAEDICPRAGRRARRRERRMRRRLCRVLGVCFGEVPGQF